MDLGLSAFFLSQAKYASASSFWADVIYMASMLLASLFVVSFGRELASSTSTRRLAIAGCALTIIGAGASMIHSVLVDGSVAALIWGKSFSGLGLGLFWIAWGKHLVSYELENIESIVLGWLPVLISLFVLAAVLFWASSLSIPVVTAVVTVLPVVSLAMLLHLTRRQSPASDMRPDDAEAARDAGERDHAGAPTPNQTGNDAVRARKDPNGRAMLRSVIVHCLAFSAIILCWNCVLSLAGLQPAPAMLVFAAGTLIALVAMALSFATTTGMRASTLYRWSLPAATIGIAVFQLLEGSGGTPLVFIGCALLAAANIGYESMTRLFALYVAKFSCYGPVQVVAVGFAIPTVGSLAGYILWEAVSLLGGSPAVSMRLALSIALVTLALVSSLTLGRDQPIRSIAQCDTNKGENAAPDGCPVRTVSPAEASAPGDARTDSASTTSPLEVRCLELSRSYGLTPKETEVLVLLAQGHSRTYIREALFISKRTVDAHVHHIYGKMGINSRDELIQMASDTSTIWRSDRERGSTV